MCWSTMFSAIRGPRSKPIAKKALMVATVTLDSGDNHSTIGHQCTTMGHNLYLTGGTKGSGVPYSEVHVLDMTQWKWKRYEFRKSNSPPPRWDHRVVAFDNVMVLFGGYSSKDYYNDVYTLDPGTPPP
jgi:hypothetical protein